MFKYTLTIWIELICFVMCLIYLRADKGWWKNFSWFLLVTVLTEATGFYIHFGYRPGHSNEWLYNLYLPVEMAFLCLLLYRIMKTYGMSVAWFIGAYAVFLCIYLVESTGNRFLHYSGLSNMFASIMIVVCCCLFYYYLLRANDYIDLPVYGPFWLISGLFIFYFGSTGLNSFLEPLKKIYETTGIPVRFIIMVVLNFILYACWSYAFICRNRNKISSSPLSSSRPSF